VSDRSRRKRPGTGSTTGNFELSAVRVGARRVRVRQSDFDAFIGEDVSTVDADPALAEARASLKRALDTATRASKKADRATMVMTLRALAEAASALAQNLDADPPQPKNWE